VFKRAILFDLGIFLTVVFYFLTRIYDLIGDLSFCKLIFDSILDLK
jgi:hypothetical protein